MTKKIAIVCNHCHQEIDPENGIGLHFTSNSSARVAPMREAENHLCLGCAKGYLEALRSVLSIQPYIGYDQISHMVDRFLAWPLPDNFNPDGGINYSPSLSVDPEYPFPSPTGTNLLDSDQARKMVEHMVKGMPAFNSTPSP